MSDNSFIIEDVLIFTGDDIIETGYVVVRDGRISEIGSGKCPDADSTLLRMSKPGYTLMPGLIDSHIHGLYGNTRCIEQSLRFGVTTVLDMHNEPHHIKKLQQVRTTKSTFRYITHITAARRFRQDPLCRLQMCRSFCYHQRWLARSCRPLSWCHAGSESNSRLVA